MGVGIRAIWDQGLGLLGLWGVLGPNDLAKGTVPLFHRLLREPSQALNTKQACAFRHEAYFCV